MSILESMTYSTATVIEYRNRNLCFQPTVLKRQPPLYAAAPQNARHNASWCNFVDCIIFSTRRLEEREKTKCTSSAWLINSKLGKKTLDSGYNLWISGFQTEKFVSTYQIKYPNLNLRIQNSSYEVCCLFWSAVWE